MWLDATLGVFGCAVVLGGVWVTNSYYLPENLARTIAAERGIPWPEGGLLIPLGIPYPVLIAIGVMAYELLAGRPPHSGDSVDALWQAKLSQDPPPLWQLNPAALD